MSLITIKPLEQVLAEGATLAALKVADKGSADEYSRAQTALKIAAVFTAYGAGDIGALGIALSAASAAIKDPAEVQLATDLLAVGEGAFNLMQALPNALAEAIAANIGKGMTTIASAVQAPAAAPAATEVAA